MPYFYARALLTFEWATQQTSGQKWREQSNLLPMLVWSSSEYYARSIHLDSLTNNKREEMKALHRSKHSYYLPKHYSGITWLYGGLHNWRYTPFYLSRNKSHRESTTTTTSTTTNSKYWIIHTPQTILRIPILWWTHLIIIMTMIPKIIIPRIFRIPTVRISISSNNNNNNVGHPLRVNLYWNRIGPYKLFPGVSWLEKAFSRNIGRTTHRRHPYGLLDHDTNVSYSKYDTADVEHKKEH